MFIRYGCSSDSPLWAFAGVAEGETENDKVVAKFQGKTDIIEYLLR
jgi:hypothetical protein